MNKSILLLMSLFVILLTMYSCNERKELQEVRGQVLHLVIDGDSINGDSLKLIHLSVGTDTLMFKIATDVSYTNGAILPGDSVQLYYINGGDDMLSAVIVNVLQRSSRIIELGQAVCDTLSTTGPEQDLVPETPKDPSSTPSQPAYTDKKK